MSRRQTEGSETWRRLRDWDRGQAPSERLAAHILRIEGYEAIDPSHPLGGQDGLKDIVCAKDRVKFIGASYFPRGQQTFKIISNKFANDLAGIVKNAAEGVAFITNQELTLGERDELIKTAGQARVDLFHLERMASILDSPQCYGIRLEFLDIEMTKEEQLAFFWTLTSAMDRWRDQANEILEAISKAGILSDAVSSEGIVKLQRSLTSMSDFPLMRLSISLQRTTEELADFQNKLATTSDIPLMQLSIALRQITETLDSFQNKLHSLSSDELREYEIELDRILTKLERVQKKSLTQ